MWKGDRTHRAILINSLIRGTHTGIATDSAFALIFSSDHMAVARYRIRRQRAAVFFFFLN